MTEDNMQGHRALQKGQALNDGKYTITGQIGEGGFSITYKAIQRGLNRIVCVKEYFPAGRCVRNTQARTVMLQAITPEMFEKYRKSFVHEAQTLAALKHPNIVEVIDVFDENNTSYMVMSFIEGESLQRIVDRSGKLSYADAVNYLAQITGAVGYLHERHILHRDIKPDNIMITADHKAILIDFGSAREFEHDKTQAHTSMITHGYAPTEQYTTNSKKGSYTDIYAIGATLYFVLTGKVPLEAAARLTEKLEEPKELSPEIPNEANRTILKAMQLKAENRHQTIKEFMDDLRNVRPSILIDETIGSRARRRLKPWMIAVSAAIAVLVIVLVALSVATSASNAKHERLMNEMTNGNVERLEVTVDGSTAYLRPAAGELADGDYYVIKGGLEKGRIFSPPTDSYIYSGSMKDGLPHGVGEAVYKDGSRYEGAFNQGLKHGQGKLYFAGGVVYEGDYANDKASGRGKMTYADGSVYDGEWRDDQQNGYGRFFNPAGEEIMAGMFENGNLIEPQQQN